MKKLASLFLVALAGVLILTLPVMAAPKALSEAEMDAVTAAGQPEVLIAGTVTSTGVQGVGAVTLAGTIDSFLTIAQAQVNLRAITLNNIVGENAVATATNISSSRSAISGGQDNLIEQVWASQVDIFVTSSPGGAATNSGKCVLCKFTGGNATSKAQTIFSDEILIGATVDKRPDKEFLLTFDVGAQDSLAALTVNNVTGQNLVATGLNIASGDLRIQGGSNTALAIDGVAATNTNTQKNAIYQYRGIPKTRP